MTRRIGARTLKRTMQNGVNLDMTDGALTRYDAAGRPLRWAHVDSNQQGAPVVGGFEHSYDRAGNKLSSAAIHDVIASERYAYDSDSRLTSFVRGEIGQGGADYCSAPVTQPWTGMTQTQNWTLDGVGNWSALAQKVDGTTANETRQDTSFNEYYSVGSTAILHDENGNMTSDGRYFYEYDLFDRLFRVRTLGGAIVATYYYDAENRRVRKEVAGGATTDYLYDGWRVIEERPVASGVQGAASKQKVYGNYLDEVLVMDTDADADGVCNESGTDTRHYYHQNSIYTVVAISNADGGVVEAYEYDPYGEHVRIADGDDAVQMVGVARIRVFLPAALPIFPANVRFVCGRSCRTITE